jgi:APA family basic amino acid/polyamine antiporter
MVTIALMRLRKIEPHLYRPFKVPLYPYVPILAIGAFSFIILTLSLEALVLGAAFGGIGLLLLFISRKVRKDQTSKSNIKSH